MRIGVAGSGRIGAFHASTLKGLDFVDEVVVADAQPARARQVADDLGVTYAESVEAMLASGLDGFVIAATTSEHGVLLRAGVAAGVPTFCEKPVAATLEESLELIDLEKSTDVPIQIGFQRRFDAGYRAAKVAVDSGELGFVHTLRVNTHDQAPPAPEYIPNSGGIFRDCLVHDFDILRFVTGHEVARVYASGGNKGEAFFAESGDVATGAALLTLDDGTMVTATATRYNGGGHDVRMDVMGEKGTIGVGYDDSLAVRSAEAGVEWPAGPQKWSFMERFQPAYVTELTTFAEVAAGRIPSPCTVEDALQAFRTAEACDISLREGRVVEMSEIPGGL